MTEVKTPGEVFISKLTGIILSNIENEKFGVNDLVRESGMSLYRLGRKLHSVNKKTINQFIREVRLHRALEMLRTGDYTASEVAYKTGFSSPTYFTKRFHQYFGYPPGKVKIGNNFLKETHHEEQIMDKVGSTIPVKRKRIISVPGSMFLLFLAAATIITYNWIQKSINSDKIVSSDGSITIAVMPFLNQTNDSLWNIWQEGIQTNLITSLSNTEDLKVRQVETINGLIRSSGLTDYASITPSIARKISKRLEASTFVAGSINQADTLIRLNARLIKQGNEEVIKSYQIDGTDIIKQMDSLSNLIRNTLLISKLKTEVPISLQDSYLKLTESPEAYRYFILGNKSFYQNDFQSAIGWFSKAYETDSSLVGALGKLSLSYYNMGNYQEGKYWCLRSYEKEDLMPPYNRLWNKTIYSLFFETFNDRIYNLRQVAAYDDQNPMIYFNIGDCYYEMAEYKNAIPEFEKALGMFKKWKIKPYWGAFYYELGISYHKEKEYKKERRLYKKADRDFPEDPGLFDQHAWLALTLGDTLKAQKYIEKWTLVRKKELWSDAQIASYMAYVYDMAGMTDQTERSLRLALSLEPGNPVRMSSLAGFLIEKERNIQEGLDLVDKALEINPESYNSLHNKGWGLYKMGKYVESKEFLQKSWDLRMQTSIYNHKAFLHLEEAKKTVEKLTL